jgi:hypothetical protein
LEEFQIPAMKSSYVRNLIVLEVLFMAAWVAGCTKTFDLRPINRSSVPLTVWYKQENGPGIRVGDVGANNEAFFRSKLPRYYKRYELQIDIPNAPTQYRTTSWDQIGSDDNRTTWVVIIPEDK